MMDPLKGRFYFHSEALQCHLIWQKNLAANRLFLLCGTPTESIAMHITYHNVNETGTLQNIITIQNVRLLSYSVIFF